ncbi:hypothetical protein [Taibaiella soli]|uniref:Response regulatory domain-containing protein n=1 Tax=Taibaiella soli TaxID=1649169 RepID=A0A2W2AH10_9BACT|nr:hypothetical protein [Taibaiella soli]PZF74561.1 hypothetical protein DN068_03010 [Taibaiella soli]
MNTTEILVVSKDQNVLPVMMQQINNHTDWMATGASGDEDAIEKYHHHSFDLVVLAADIDENETRKMRRIFSIQHNDMLIVDSVNLDSLETEIEAAIIRHNAANNNYSFTDNAFANAQCNITIIE